MGSRRIKFYHRFFKKQLYASLYAAKETTIKKKWPIKGRIFLLLMWLTGGY